MPRLGRVPDLTGPQPSRRRGDLAALAAGLGLAVALALGRDAPAGGSPADVLRAAGSFAGLAGAYLCLVAILLASRLPWLERGVGHDRMIGWHRRLGPWALGLVAVHVVASTAGTAAGSAVLPYAWALVTGTAWMLPAAAGFALLVAPGLACVPAVRARMAYETWWVGHLYLYLGVALAFGHQVALGPAFAGAPLARGFWAGLYGAVAAVVLWARVVRPAALSARHRLRVLAVVPEAGGAVSVHIGGVRLDRLGARGGQFLLWRFGTRDWWWQAHPYSLSAAPGGDRLRITVKALGDQSRALAALRPGTRVFAEGPYGVFTAGARGGDRVAAFAAGVGIAPVRALLDDLPAQVRVTVVHRASAAGAPLRAELEEEAARRGWTVLRLDGPRSRHPITPAALLDLVPDLAESDVYVCGPAGFSDAVRAAARAAGVPAARIHHESFAYAPARPAGDAS